MVYLVSYHHPDGKFYSSLNGRPFRYVYHPPDGKLYAVTRSQRVNPSALPSVKESIIIYHSDLPSHRENILLLTIYYGVNSALSLRVNFQERYIRGAHRRFLPCTKE